MNVSNVIIPCHVQDMFGFIAIFLTFAALLPYIYNTITERIKPHAFSWIIWGASNIIIFAAQFSNNAGIGCYSIGAAGIIAIGIAIAAYIKKADDSITKMDIYALWAGLAALPLWFITSSPLVAVILLTIIDVVIGYTPTIRKASDKPHEEGISMFIIMSLRNTFSLLSLDEYSFTNTFFQITTLIANFIVIFLILYRKRQLRATL